MPATKPPLNPSGDVSDAESDEALAIRAQGGDPSAFRALYDRHAPLLVPRLTRVLQHRADVEDVLQMTFLEAHRSLKTWDRRHAFGAWVGGIAFNVTGVFLRSKKRRWWKSVDAPVQHENAVATTPSSEDETLRHELARQFARALDELPAKKRIAFVLHDVEGLGLTEIGTLVGSSPQTLWARVRSARAAVRSFFERHGYGQDPS